MACAIQLVQLEFVILPSQYNSFPFTFKAPALFRLPMLMIVSASADTSEDESAAKY